MSPSESEPMTNEQWVEYTRRYFNMPPHGEPTQHMIDLVKQTKSDDGSTVLRAFREIQAMVSSPDKAAAEMVERVRKAEAEVILQADAKIEAIQQCGDMARKLQAAEAHVARLQATQLPAGCMAVCRLCKYEEFMDYDDSGFAAWADCVAINCPLKVRPTSEEKSS